MVKKLSEIQTRGGMTLEEIIKEVPILKEEMNTHVSEKLFDKIAKYIGYLTIVECEQKETISQDDYDLIKATAEELQEVYRAKRYEEWIQVLLGATL